MDSEHSNPAKSRLVPALILSIALFNVIAFVSFVWWMRPPKPPALLAGNAQVAAAHATYMSSEGPANRGPAFEQFVLELDDWRHFGGGPTVTEAQMVQLLGAPDLMLRTEDGAIFAYFYSRFGQRDWVVYFEYFKGKLTVFWNAASADPAGHADMVPYAPPGTTQPSTGGS